MKSDYPSGHERWKKKQCENELQELPSGKLVNFPSPSVISAVKYIYKFTCASFQCQSTSLHSVRLANISWAGQRIFYLSASCSLWCVT